MDKYETIQLIQMCRARDTTESQIWHFSNKTKKSQTHQNYYYNSLKKLLFQNKIKINALQKRIKFGFGKHMMKIH